MILLRTMLGLLLAFFVLGAEGEADDAGDAGDDTGTGDSTLDDLIDVAESADPAPDRSAGADPATEIETARRRAEAAENRLEAERAARQAAEARATPQQSNRDPDYEREEAEIAAARSGGATADQLNWLQWKVDSNRRMRASQMASYGALAQAQDLQDRTSFERLEITNPSVFKRYGAKVEAAMQEMRGRGQNAPRLAVLRLLIGDDVMSGKLKPKARKAAADAPASTVERGRTLATRGDVSAKTRLTEHEKRKQRLENQII